MAHAQNRSRIHFGVTAAIALWAVTVISCTTISRVAIAPPSIPGATFVGTQECALCHESMTTRFAGATHASLEIGGGNAVDIGCESCHGPGSTHVQSGGSLFTIVNPGRDPESCFQCHLDKRGEFSLPNTHHVLDGKMSCSDCHDVHEGRAATGNGAPLAGISDSCISCHVAQRGPYVFEHEAVSRDGCLVCHSPHGSVNAKMLKARNASLCLQCHFQNQTGPNTIEIGGRDHSSFLGRGTCWSAGCHEAVHGSHVNSSLRF